MSDPLSVAAGIAGVVTAAAQISSLLINFTKSTIGAPQQVKVVLAEVSDIGGILSHLQSFLFGLDTPERSRTALLKVEKVVTIVGSCVLTFSELEKLLDDLKTENLNLLDSLKWARKESAIVALIQRLHNHKASLSIVLDILNGHTIAETRDSVDRLHGFVERYYKEMSSRVQALEVRNVQKDDACWVSEEDTESIATIHVTQPDASSEDIMESGLGHFDFSNELQRSRVYRRNQAFRKSVISALTNSEYSQGWSFFSDLSMAEVSNISVINLAVTKGEVFNPGRSLQTWSAQPNSGVSSNDYVDGQCTQLYELTDRPVQRSASLANVGESRPASTQIQRRSLPETRSSSPRSQQLERRNNYPLWKEIFGDKESTKIAGNLNPTSTLLSADHWDPPSWSTQIKATSSSQCDDLVDNECGETHFTPPVSPNQVQATSPQFHGWVEDEEAYPCKGCGEILQEGKAFELNGDKRHIDCFRCNTCGTILDSDAKLLLLGDGSLICDDCKYSCSVCNEKIEDLAILTGDQAFCATCFKCRNCKEKIKNLKYARTSQGIFCMDCHESLMKRHRKKESAKRKALAKGKQPEQTILVIPKSPELQHLFDKELPPLPALHLEAQQELRDIISGAITLTTTEGAEWPKLERLADPSVIFPFEQYVKKDNHKQGSPEYFF